MERYLEPAKTQQIRRTFASLWGLEQDGAETERVVQDAISHPERYVLKPQREGGGKNTYGKAVAAKLREFSPQQRAAHILQQRLNPLVVKVCTGVRVLSIISPLSLQNYMLRPMEKTELRNVVGELGIYGCLLGKMTEEGFACELSLSSGHLLRTKDENADEGGIRSGCGAIDSPFLA